MMYDDICIKPMTPTRRSEIDKAFDAQIEELKSCKQNSIVKLQISGLQTYKKMIHNLPDGYPLPVCEEMERK